MIVEERKHAGKHLGILGFETISDNPQGAVSALVSNKSRRIHERHLAVLSFWTETC